MRVIGPSHESAVDYSLSLSLSLSDAASETSEIAPTELPALAESQSKELEKAYITGHYQDAAVLRDLAHRLELTDNQIQVRHLQRSLRVETASCLASCFELLGGTTKPSYNNAEMYYNPSKGSGNSEGY